MKAIINITAELTLEAIAAAKKKLEERLAAAIEHLGADIDQHNARGKAEGAEIWHTPVSAEARAAYLAGKLCGAPADQWISRSRAILKLRQSLAGYHRTPHPASMAIAVVGSYDMREKLKARGYRFDRDWSASIFDLRPTPAWVRVIRIDADTSPERLVEEIDFLREHGVEVTGADPLSVLSRQAALNVHGGGGSAEQLPSVPY